MVNFNALKTQAEYLLAKMEHGNGYKIGDVSQRLRQAADENPGDVVIGSVAHIVERLSSKDPVAIITQGQLEEIYQELVGLNPNTRFREVVGDLLKTERKEADLTNQEYIGVMRDPVHDPLNYDLDGEVKEGFDNLFSTYSDKYEPQNASRAKEKVELELRSMGFDNSHVKLACGNSRFLIFSASLDTNRGTIPVYIPADSSGDSLPSIFVGSNKFEHLTSSKLSDYLDSSACNKENLPEAHSVLSAIDQVLGAVSRKVGVDDFAKISSSVPNPNGSEGLATPGLFAELSEEKPIKDISIPETPIPRELKTIASDVEESVLESAVGYPQSSVRLAKRMIISELDSIGFKNSQTRVSSPTNDGFICETILNTPEGKVKIEIPIEMSGDVPLLPSVFAKNDYIADFNAANLHALALKESSYVEGFVSDSQLHSMSINELKDIISKSASKGDFDTCDEVMEIISNKFNEDTYRSVVSDYHNLLLKLKTAKSNLCESYDDNQFIKTPNSIYPVHKKLGLPAHKLVKDENGVWYRRSGFEDKKQERLSTFFSTAKVLVGD